MDAPQTTGALIAERWPIILVALLAIVVVTVYPTVLRTVQIAQIPTVGAELGGTDKRRQAYIASARKLYNYGYRNVFDYWGLS